MSTPDALTVLRSHKGVLTKRLSYKQDGWHPIGFSAGLWFAAHRINVDGFDDLVAALEEIGANPRLCVIRGELLPHVDPHRHRRLSDRAEHGDVVTYEAKARRWLALDFDSVPEPPGTNFALTLEKGVEHVLGLVPEPFGGASCWWQATASAGIKPGVRCRLWFWLNRPVSDGEAKGWLRSSPVDRSLFTPVALHYTAPPILEPGTSSPIAKRSGVRRGLTDTVTVPDALPVFETSNAVPVALDGLELGGAELETLFHAARRSPLVLEIWTGARTYPDRSTGHFALAAALVREGCTDPDTLHQVLAAYGRRRNHDPSKIQRADYVRRTIGAALATVKCR